MGKKGRTQEHNLCYTTTPLSFNTKTVHLSVSTTYSLNTYMITQDDILPSFYQQLHQLCTYYIYQVKLSPLPLRLCMPFSSKTLCAIIPSYVSINLCTYILSLSSTFALCPSACFLIYYVHPLLNRYL